MKKQDFKLLPPYVEEYLRYLSVVKAKSDLTIIEYATDLRLFFRFIAASKDGISPADLPEEYSLRFIDKDYISSIDYMDAYGFLDYCRSERDNDVSARARKISAIKGFYKYITTNRRYIDENPMLALEAPKPKKRLPKYLSLEQSLQLLNAVDGEYKVRDYCMLTLLLNCGMRLAELVGINLSDIDMEKGTLILLGKGDKQRMVYLNKACKDAINAYLAVRPRDSLRGEDRNALFISRLNKRISRRGVQDLVYKYLEKIGLADQGFSVHKLRHTAATLMYQHGNVDVLVLKDILGHENLATTEIYTHLLSEQLRAAAESNPLSGESMSNKTNKS